MNVFSAIFLIFAGHFLGALILYLNHRFVFHGKLGRLPVLSKIKRLHAMHHAHPDDIWMDEFIFVPVWARLIIATAVMAFGVFINAWVAIGVASFMLLYSYRHYEIHTRDRTSKFHNHHGVHHAISTHNFSGIYPFIDDIFGTALK